MPQTSSAKKRMRRDERKTIVNVRRKRSLKELIKKARETKTAEAVRLAVAAVDKAVKNNIFHRNKAARVKSQLTKGMKETAVKAPAKKSSKAAKSAKPKAKAKSKASSSGRSASGRKTTKRSR